MITTTTTTKSLQSCPTLCDPIDGSPPGSAIPGILQARTLEWVAISFSSAWKWKVRVKSLSRVRLFMTPWTAAHQAPPSMGFSRQENWSGVPLPSPPNVIIPCKYCKRGIFNRSLYNIYFFFLFLDDRAYNPWSQEQVKNLAVCFLAFWVKIKVSNTAFTKGGVMLFFFFEVRPGKRWRPVNISER